MRNYIKRSEINEEIKLIPGTVDYISPSGEIYKNIKDDLYLHRSTFINKHNGYKYTALTTTENKQIQRRVHILVAEAYIPNPDNFNIVMHKNNIKYDTDYRNLKWGTVSENTKQAFDDGLANNDIGFNDSQSFPVVQLDLNKNIINIFGSISLASKITGLSKGTIINQCNHNVKTKPRCGYYFRFLEEYDFYGFVL